MLYRIDDHVAVQDVTAFFQYTDPVYHQPIYNPQIQGLIAGIPGMAYAPLASSWITPQYSTTPAYPTPVSSHQFSPITVLGSSSSPEENASQQGGANMTGTTFSMPDDSHDLTSGQKMRHDSGVPMLSQADVGPFRKSAWELEPDLIAATSQMPFQTSIFRK